MRLDDSTDLGPNAYAAYGRAVSFRTHDGHPMPMWEALGDTIQNAWRAVASEIVAYLADAAQEDEDMSSAPEQSNTPAATTSGRQPSQGGIVLVGTDPQTNNGSATTPAIITRVWLNGMVNVRAFPDASIPTKSLTSLSYIGSVEELAPGRWAWPPRT